MRNISISILGVLQVTSRFRRTAFSVRADSIIATRRRWGRVLHAWQAQALFHNTIPIPPPRSSTRAVTQSLPPPLEPPRFPSHPLSPSLALASQVLPLSAG